jgi:hypothetical protein
MECGMDHRDRARRPSGYRTAAAVVLALATMVGFATSAQATTAGQTTVKQATAGPAARTPLVWQENLAQPTSSTNIEKSGGQSRIADSRIHPAAQAGAAGYGMELFAAHTLTASVNQVSATLSDTVPNGARVLVDVRGRQAGENWTEWTSTTSASPATFRSPVSDVQVRLTLWDNETGQSPTIRGLTVAAALRGTSAAASGPFAPAQESYQVYATREGLVGGTTANGHVIVDNDHFVALPSGSALSDEGTDDYSGQVCGPSQCETAPVWDIGPWNVQDDYWDANRAEFTDLPQGEPEAQAAYEDGYNNDIDDLGGSVSNPAGIDLADGTFYDVGLDDNGWVTVTYLWT